MWLKREQKWKGTISALINLKTDCVFRMSWDYLLRGMIYNCCPWTMTFRWPNHSSHCSAAHQITCFLWFMPFSFLDMASPSSLGLRSHSSRRVPKGSSKTSLLQLGLCFLNYAYPSVVFSFGTPYCLLVYPSSFLECQVPHCTFSTPMGTQ